jgi:type VI protein secretion system component VasF
MSVSRLTVVIRRGLHQQLQGQRRERAADSPAWQRAAGRARWLSWASLACMTAEEAIAIAAVLAGSVALLGPGR